jgi:hypothetical protein
MSDGKKTPPEPRATIDLSAIRYLLTLTPDERLRLAAEEARNLALLEAEVEKARRER